MKLVVVALASIAAFAAGQTRAQTAAPPVRSCDSSVYGALAPDWQKSAVPAGPVWFYFFGTHGRPAEFAHIRGNRYRYRPFKVLAIVRAGVVATATVPPEERARLALFYAPNQSVHRALRISEGQRSVTFEACADQDTQFNGGFVVAGAHCAALDVRVQGSDAPVRIALPFGVRAC